jgi:hypothetical protein
MKHIIGSVIGVLCVYMLGAFVETSFNIAEWDRGTRFCVALFMPIGAAFGFAITTNA